MEYKIPGGIMKTLFLAMGVLAICITSISQEIQHEAVVINIEVPVRVFKGDTFIDNLTIDDFEVYEDGVLQEVAAVYLIKKAEIKRREEKGTSFKPAISSRHYVLYFEIVEYLPKIGEVLDYFFSEMLKPQDSLIVVTPHRTYKFDSRSFGMMPKQNMAEQLKNKIRADAWKGNREYRNLLREFKDLEKLKMPEQEDLKHLMLMEIVRQIKNQKFFDEKKASEFASYLKEQEGQKHVFFFYQKEMFPIPPAAGAFDILELMSTDTPVSERLEHAFADSSISCHFLYVNKGPADEEDGVRQTLGAKWMDMTVGTFQGLMEMAKATGGLTESSANIAAAFKKAADASEHYYLLYYTPKDYKSDGKFRNIKVKIRGKNYKVLHRAGYLAD
jgi:hypothetical protein